VITYLARYLHTVRYLRLRQIFGRAQRRLFPARPILRTAPGRRSKVGSLVRSPVGHGRLIDDDQFNFLNSIGRVAAAGDWNTVEKGKLWLYNLHYFDWLFPERLPDAKGAYWLTRWVQENPPGRGVGWEPYPTSLRIVNWIKWTLRGGELPPNAEESLLTQLLWLSRNVEHHLLGNHLLANAKALIFGGAFFVGPIASGCLERGMRILLRELREQILPDGGHFERSPMYHSIVLMDILDLVALLGCYGLPDELALKEIAGRMLEWLEVMTHPDGEISFFNDSALCIAPRLTQIREYAALLGISSQGSTPRGLRQLSASGYARFESGRYVCMIDLAPVGADYIPGHGHADTLSYEISIGSERVAVNSGVSTYEKNEIRQSERSTAAHNTVEVDFANSSDVWGGFRVGRRARVFGIDVDDGNIPFRVTATHDGYRNLRGCPLHTRTWEFGEDYVSILDVIGGEGTHTTVSHLHVHPSCSVELSEEDQSVLLKNPDEKAVAQVTFLGIQAVKLLDYIFNHSFGLGYGSTDVVCINRGLLPLRFTTTVRLL
jgi:uncharacterized heparinase superfamily protein